MWVEHIVTSRLVEKDIGLKKQQKKPGMTATHLPTSTQLLLISL